MAKRLVIAFGGRMMTLRRAVSTLDGWKHLLQFLGRVILWLPFFLIVHVIIAVQQFMRKQKQFENNCPVMVETADGIPARCMFYMADGKTCPRHGDVSELQKP
jgi:hypothetical protein